MTQRLPWAGRSSDGWSPWCGRCQRLTAPKSEVQRADALARGLLSGPGGHHAGAFALRGGEPPAPAGVKSGKRPFPKAALQQIDRAASAAGAFCFPWARALTEPPTPAGVERSGPSPANPCPPSGWITEGSAGPGAPSSAGAFALKRQLGPIGLRRDQRALNLFLNSF